ncbi:MAG: putative zinc-binding protein [Chloroflexi bacterium]|nr:putative zinc-binding protein [Chloroflexota bacterium]
MSNGLPDNALFVCFGGMSNVGTLTGLAALEAVKQAGPGKAAIFCLGGLPTQAPTVLDKTSKVKRIVTVDGCPLNCARKIVETAGFKPDATLTLVNDCGITKGPPTQYTADDLAVVTDAILAALRDGNGRE